MKFASFENLSSSLLIVGVALFAAGCGKDPKKPPLEYFPHMADSSAVKAQHLGPFGEPMRVAPEGTLARGTQKYPYANDPKANEPRGSASTLRNPIPRDKASLLKGQKLYNTYCIVCHGPRGEGNGSVIPKFPMPPSLHSEKVRNWADGNIFHVMTMGQNLMPSYATQMDPEERWAVVNYVRVLQRAMNPTPADIQELERTQSKAGK